MNYQQALAFFRHHQPLPTAMTPSQRNEFEAAIKHLQDHPGDPEVTVPLILNCWNESDLEGLETFLLAALRRYPVEWIVPHIAFGLNHPESMRRLWYGEVAGHFPHRHYIEPLLEMLNADENLERYIAACVLERLADGAIVEKVRQRLALEDDPEIIEVLQAML